MRVLFLLSLLSVFLLLPQEVIATDQSCSKADPHGLMEYEADGIVTPCLKACAADTSCPENRDARFWLLVDEANSLETEIGQCRWSNSADEPIRHNFIADADFELKGGEDFISLPPGTLYIPSFYSLPPSRSTTSVLGSGDAVLEERILTISFNAQSDQQVCERYADIPRTKRIFEEFEALAIQGNKKATNEVGYFYLTEPGFFDAEKAQTYLENCARDGDPDCLFNLARLHTIIEPNGCGPCVRLLKQANRQKFDPGIHIAMQLSEVLFTGRQTLTLVEDDWPFWERTNEVVNLFPAWQSRLEGLTLHVSKARAGSSRSQR